MSPIVGITGQDGYLKQYHMDRRLLTGIIPGDIALRGKFVPAPAGRPGSRSRAARRRASVPSAPQVP